jgi:hypothetical protein
MADLPADAKERIAAARRAAERKLKRDLKPLEGTLNLLACVPTFVKFACALFDAEAAELRTTAAADLEALLVRIIEGIMPDASLDAQRAHGADPLALSVELEVVTKTLLVQEKGADGVWRLASDDPAYGQHGDWESFAPEGVRFRVRRNLYPEANAAVRAALESALRSRKTYWVGQYALTRSTPLDLLNHIHRQLSNWEEVARRISVASGIKVSRSVLFAWRRAQIGKDPGKPVNAAKAQKIADGIRQVAVELKILSA